MKKKGIVILVLCALFLFLWFSDVLPPQVAKISAAHYMNSLPDGENYSIESAEYSPAHDSYFVYFRNDLALEENTRNIGVYYRFIPFFVWYDSNFPG